MPYIGNKYRNKDRLFTVKLYGPDYEFDTTPQDIEEILDRTLSSSAGAENNDLAEWVVNNVAYNVKKDDSVLWVECEVMYADGSLYGSVAELESAR